MTIDPRTIAEAVSGATVVGLALARHMPAPRVDSVVYAWIFDTVQDLAKNNDRIGERRPVHVATPPLEDLPYPPQ